MGYYKPLLDTYLLWRSRVTHKLPSNQSRIIIHNFFLHLFFFLYFFLPLPIVFYLNISLETPGTYAYHQQNPKYQGDLKMAVGVWKGVYPLIFSALINSCIMSFFDSNNSSIRKLEQQRETEKNSLVSENGCQGVPKWPTGSGRGSTMTFLGTLISFP